MYLCNNLIWYSLHPLILIKYYMNVQITNILFSFSGTRNRKYSVSSFKSALSERQLKLSNKQNDKYNSKYDIEKQTLPEENDELMEYKEKSNVPNNEKIYNTEMTIKVDEQNESILKKVLKNLVKIFDLSLFKDSIYINIMLGMSLAIFAELNFSLLTPFILRDLKLETAEIATFLSTLSIADICFRFLAPFIGDYLRQPPRIMYMFSLVLLILTRFSK